MADIDNTSVTPPESEDVAKEYVPEEDTSTPQAGEAHVEETKETSTEPKGDDEIAQKYERLRKKVSALEKEKNELSSAARIVSALNQAAVEDPKFAKDANEKLFKAGLISKEQFDQFSKTIEESKEETPKSAPAMSSPELEWVRMKQQEESRKQEQFFEEFESGKEDISEGTQEQARLRRQAIGNAAQVNIDKGMSQKDAYELAYKQILHPEKIAEDGELQGIVRAQAARPAIASASGGSSTSTSLKLTDEQLDAARRLRLTPEEYAQGLDDSFGQDVI